MSVTTFGHQSNTKDIDNEKMLSEIKEKLTKNEKDMWDKFSEQEKKLKNIIIEV